MKIVSMENRWKRNGKYDCCSLLQCFYWHLNHEPDTQLLLMCCSDPSLDEWVPFDEPLPEEFCDMGDNEEQGNKKDTKSNEEGAFTEAASSAAVMLAETPLPRMFVPGKIVHIFTHRGVFKAAIVPRAFRELRRITLAGSMLNDHMSKSYYEGLLECKSVRQARKSPPEWTGFGDEKTWCVYRNEFLLGLKM